MVAHSDDAGEPKLGPSIFERCLRHALRRHILRWFWPHGVRFLLHPVFRVCTLCDAQGVRVHPTTTITAITTHPLFPSIPEKYIFTPGALRLCSGPGFSAWRCAQSICFVFRFQSVYRTERWKKCCLEILKSGSGFGFFVFPSFFYLSIFKVLEHLAGYRCSSRITNVVYLCGQLGMDGACPKPGAGSVVLRVLASVIVWQPGIKK